MTAQYRATYHHGDARAALTQAAFDLARGGGPPQVTLRAAAREIGITAAAVYRHFTTVEELLEAVKGRASRMLADQLDEALAAVGGDPDRSDEREHEQQNEHEHGPDQDHHRQSDHEPDRQSEHDSDRYRGGDHEHDRDRPRGIGHHRDPDPRRDRGLTASAIGAGAGEPAVRSRAPTRTPSPDPTRIRAVAEAYLSFAREHPGLFGMACHGGVDAVRELVAERVGDVPRPTALAVWSAAHGVAVLSLPEADQQQVLDIVLAGIIPT